MDKGKPISASVSRQPLALSTALLPPDLIAQANSENSGYVSIFAPGFASEKVDTTSFLQISATISLRYARSESVAASLDFSQ